nr:uncharacterized protein LOC111424064 [Onthophagus taurus]
MKLVVFAITLIIACDGFSASNDHAKKHHQVKHSESSDVSKRIIPGGFLCRFFVCSVCSTSGGLRHHSVRNDLNSLEDTRTFLNLCNVCRCNSGTTSTTTQNPDTTESTVTTESTESTETTVSEGSSVTTEAPQNRHGKKHHNVKAHHIKHHDTKKNHH